MQKTITRQKFSLLMALIIALSFAVLPNFSLQTSAADPVVIATAKYYLTNNNIDSLAISGTAKTFDATKNKLVAGNVYVAELTLAAGTKVTSVAIAGSGVATPKISTKFVEATTKVASLNSVSATPAANSELTNALSKVYVAFTFASCTDAYKQDGQTITFTVNTKIAGEADEDGNPTEVVSSSVYTVKGVFTKEKGYIDTATAMTFYTAANASKTITAGSDLTKSLTYYAVYAVPADVDANELPVSIKAVKKGTTTAIAGIKYAAPVAADNAVNAVAAAITKGDVPALSAVTYKHTYTTGSGDTLKTEIGYNASAAYVCIPFSLTTAADDEVEMTFTMSGKDKSAAVKVFSTGELKVGSVAALNATNVPAISDISFGGVKKASSFKLSFGGGDVATTAKINNATISFQPMTKVNDILPKAQVLASKLTFTLSDKLFLKNLKLNTMPVVGDKIIVSNDSYTFTLTLDADAVAFFKVATPIPTVTVKGKGDTAEFVIKAVVGSDIKFYTAAGTSPITSLTKSAITTANPTIKVSDFNGASAVYVTVTDPNYGSESLKVAAYASTGTQTVAPTATVIGINKVKLVAKGIAKDDPVTIYYGSSSTASTTVKSDDGKTFYVDVSSLAETSTATKLQFALKKANETLSAKSNAVYPIYKASADITDSYKPAKVANSSANIVLKNYAGPADQIIIGALPVKTKVLVFAVPSTDSATLTAIKTMHFDATGKELTKDSAGKYNVKATTVNNYYTGVSGSAAVDKEITIKTDLSAYKNCKLFFYVINPTATDIPNTPGKFVSDTGMTVTAEADASSFGTGGLVLTSNIFYGDNTMTVVLSGTGLLKGDKVSLYNSVTGVAKTVTVADNGYVAITGIKESQGFDQISVIRANMQSLKRITLGSGTLTW